MLAKPATAPQSEFQDNAAQRKQAGAVWFLFASLLMLCYWPMLRVTASQIWNGEDMAHGLFAPVVAGYLFWENRASLIRWPSTPAWASLLVISFAALTAIAAALANSSTISRVAFLLSLAGCIVLVSGWSALKANVFPLFLLLFTFPIPDVLYGEITQPLQLLASRLSEVSFELLGFSVIRDGNILRLAHMQLSVVEACSGLRSLVTLSFFCLVYAWFFETRFWMRVFVVGGAIPAAILVNMLRITATGILGKYNPAWTKGTPHEMLGWGGFFVGFFLVLACHKLLSGLLARRNGHSGGTA